MSKPPWFYGYPQPYPKKPYLFDRVAQEEGRQPLTPTPAEPTTTWPEYLAILDEPTEEECLSWENLSK